MTTSSQAELRSGSAVGGKGLTQPGQPFVMKTSPLGALRLGKLQCYGQPLSRSR